MPKDILLDTDFDLQIADGDFVIGESTAQHQQLLLLTQKGEWKESPTVAVSAESFLKDEDETALLAEIKAQFELDGMTVNLLQYADGKLNIDAPYNT
jgi:hypothetical protein